MLLAWCESFGDVIHAFCGREVMVDGVEIVVSDVTDVVGGDVDVVDSVVNLGNFGCVVWIWLVVL